MQRISKQIQCRYRQSYMYSEWQCGSACPFLELMLSPSPLLSLSAKEFPPYFSNNVIQSISFDSLFCSSVCFESSFVNIDWISMHIQVQIKIQLQYTQIHRCRHKYGHKYITLFTSIISSPFFFDILSPPSIQPSRSFQQYLCSFIIDSSSILYQFIMYSLSIHHLFIIYSLSIHYLFILYSLPLLSVHYLFIIYYPCYLFIMCPLFIIICQKKIQVFLMDPWWNPAVEQQAQDRIHRLGQYKPIQYDPSLIIKPLPPSLTQWVAGTILLSHPISTPLF